MKTRIVFLVYYLLSSAFSYSQNGNKENTTEKFLQELKQQKVDTICTFEDYSVGSVYIYRSNDSTSLSKIVVRSETVIKD